MSYFKVGLGATNERDMPARRAGSNARPKPKKKPKKKKPPQAARGRALAIKAKLGQKGRPTGRPPGRAVGWGQSVSRPPQKRPPQKRPPAILTYPAPGTKPGAVTATAPVLEPAAPVSSSAPSTGGGGGGGGGSVWSDDATAAPDELELDEDTGDAVTEPAAPAAKKPMSTAAKLGVAAAVVGAGIWYWLEAKG